jgi:hypothetical protein
VPSLIRFRLVKSNEGRGGGVGNLLSISLVFVLTFIGGLQQVVSELVEADKIDGCASLDFWRVSVKEFLKRLFVQHGRYSMSQKSTQTGIDHLNLVQWRLWMRVSIDVA